jgi:ribosomal-protein-alanine N-acetyltransferase
MIGTIGAYDFDPEKNQIEVGFSIERASWGYGYAAEAVQDNKKKSRRKIK